MESDMLKGFSWYHTNIYRIKSMKSAENTLPTLHGLQGQHIRDLGTL